MEATSVTPWAPRARDKPSDIAILSTRTREKSLVHGVESVAGLRLVDASLSKSDDLIFSTMHAFKGLERSVVLVIDVDDQTDATRAMLLYTGLSRVRTVLHVFLNETSRADYMAQVAVRRADFGGLSTTALVPAFSDRAIRSAPCQNASASFGIGRVDGCCNPALQKLSLQTLSVGHLRSLERSNGRLLYRRLDCSG